MWEPIANKNAVSNVVIIIISVKTSAFNLMFMKDYIIYSYIVFLAKSIYIESHRVAVLCIQKCMKIIINPFSNRLNM